MNNYPQHNPEVLRIPEVVTLCGSTKFKDQFIEANFKLTMAGVVVLSVGWFSHADGVQYTPTPAEKERLDWLHLRKIDMSDAIYVVNVGGYIGASTKREVDHAIKTGKLVYWLNDHCTCGDGPMHDSPCPRNWTPHRGDPWGLDRFQLVAR